MRPSSALRAPSTFCAHARSLRRGGRGEVQAIGCKPASNTGGGAGRGLSLFAPTLGPKSELQGPKSVSQVRINPPNMDLRSEPSPNLVFHEKQIWTWVQIFRTQGPSPNLQGPYFLDPGPNSPKVRIPLGPRGAEGAAAKNEDPRRRMRRGGKMRALDYY